ncbi:unnamed protein product [Ambrosiozyma monospora]|uniref:Unnamed protein product n=1 Tax=Ambrosiozyma monospora TaxID=43982 RepID=A0ACB5SW23_AMBMO|nr:unnamed protein product [Ambrosiozyma monospora]
MFRQSLRSLARVNKFAGVRTYAEAANSDVLKLSLALPHTVCSSSILIPVTPINFTNSSIVPLVQIIIDYSFETHIVDWLFTTTSQLNVPGFSGEMGILANHVPIVEQLKPGVVEVIEEAGSTKYFISGGFINVLPNSKVNITTVEAFKLEDFSAENVKTLLAEAQKNAASADEAVSAEANIQIEVLESLQAAGVH